MVKWGDEDRKGAFEELDLALEEARRIDPGGPREQEVRNYMALFQGSH